MMLNKLNILITCLIVCFSAPNVRGSDFHSPRTDALGGAGHASPFLTDSLYLNPSYSSFLMTHALGLEYLLFCCGTIQTPAGPSDFYGHNLNVSVVDGTADSLFQAGVGFTRRDDSSLIHIGASKGIAQKWGIGIGSKFIFPNDASGARYADGTLSVSGIFAKWFQTTLIVDNLVESAASKGFYREFTLGTKFEVEKILALFLDPLWVPSLPVEQNRWGFEAGIEFPFFSEIFLRGGMFKNANIPYQAQRGDGFGVGLGWLGPKLSLEYAFSRVTGPLSSNSHNFGFNVFF